MKHNSKVEIEKEMDTQFLCSDKKEKDLIIQDDTETEGGGKPRPDGKKVNSQGQVEEDDAE
jgi:hypothetical protein